MGEVMIKSRRLALCVCVCTSGCACHHHGGIADNVFFVLTGAPTYQSFGRAREASLLD